MTAGGEKEPLRKDWFRKGCKLKQVCRSRNWGKKIVECRIHDDDFLGLKKGKKCADARERLAGTILRESNIPCDLVHVVLGWNIYNLLILIIQEHWILWVDFLCGMIERHGCSFVERMKTKDKKVDRQTARLRLARRVVKPVPGESKPIWIGYYVLTSNP